MDLGSVIAQADSNVFHMNTRLQKLMSTFANTLRWQIAAAAIQTVTSKIREAIDYTKDLNNALNDIRIVTGYGEITMEGFAEKAAKAAKALNTTTVEYTKAALIFYQ
jgi:hypothetical protein